MTANRAVPAPSPSIRPRPFMNDPTASMVLGILFLSLAGCGAGGEGEPTITTASTPTGASASLAWDPVQDSTVTGYSVHYGTQSAGEPGLCSYQDSKFVTGPSTTITGLNSDTRYYFAVSAYNGLNGPCSNEVSTVTPPSQT
ncbi:MAG: fibronectin type III domain-containing protein [Nitrospiraceae bacterium]